ncbi:MAG: glycosyltransferase family 39 protein [Gammaproteobacteria bacterium]|nr:glycosyltransferase family 39 protein [Gammaproteobacteria bacterium]
MMRLSRTKEHVIFTWFLLAHVLVWTLLPALLRFTLPLDAMEGATWGHQLQWGYDKNPFLNAWLTRLALLFGSSGWATYLFSQISVALCFWAVWRLALKFFTPIAALIGVMMLEGLQYYNFHAIDFNDNTLELSLWALTIYYFYQALTDKKYFDWICVGLFAGLGMMAKYYTTILLLPLFTFMLFNREARKSFLDKKVYVGVFVFLLIMLPHIVWLISHDFVTVHYAADRVSSTPLWVNHIFFPLQFAWQQFEVFVPGFILLLPFYLQRKSTPVFDWRAKRAHFNRDFLLFAGLGPLLLTIVISFLTGIKLRAGWGQPLLSYSGILLLMWWRPYITRRTVSAFFVLWVAFFITISVGYGVALRRALDTSTAFFPGKTIASTLTAEWKQRYHQTLKYVVGPRWYAGNIAFYSYDHPAVYMEADPIKTQWIDEADLKKQGAIFIWDSQDAFIALRQRFPALTTVKHLQFNWQRNLLLPPVDVWVALLPPVRK